MSKLDAKVFSSITPFSKQWILGDELMYEFLNQYQDFLSDSYGIVDLGSLNWYLSGENLYAAVIPVISIWANDSAADPNIKVSSLSVCSRNDISQYEERAIAHKQNYILYYSSTKTAAEVKAAMSGVYLVYKLADNIGRVRLGGLNWEEGGAPGGFLVDGTQMQALGIKQGLCTLYCSNFGVYLENFQWVNFATIPNNVVAKNYGNYVLYAKATDYTEPSDFKASLANTYLYFEKQS